MQAYITNLHAYTCGYLIGEWIQFPISKENLRAVFKRIGIVRDCNKNSFDGVPNDLIAKGLIGEEFFFTDYQTTDIPFNTKNIVGEYTPISVMNELAELIDSLDGDEYSLLQSYCESQHDPTSIDDLKKILEEIDNGSFYLIDAKDNYDLGQYLVDGGVFGRISEQLADYIDYDKIGEEYAQNGSFTTNGFFLEA